MNRRIAVTGAASGIGAALARDLRDGGDAVLGIDLHDTEVSADLATPTGRTEAIAEVDRWCGGRLDALVTCAGISGDVPTVAAVNYFGTTELCTGLRGLLAGANAPRVAVVGSISGIQPVDDALVEACLDGDQERASARSKELLELHRGAQLYPSSKAALARWLRRTAVADGWADAGIPLNAVAPGVVLSPMTDELLSDAGLRELVDAAVPMPLHGYAQPGVIAACLAWLISPANSHITGQVIYADGGAEVTFRGQDVW